MTEQTPAPVLVSFIIPNYNHAHYVGDAIRSALAQTHRNIEIIVVDDGSTDDSRSVIESFVAAQGERVRYIHQANAGLSAARNTGVEAAAGDYITLLDADDLVEPAYVESLLGALAQSPDAAGAYCGYRFVDEDNRNLPRSERRVVAPESLYVALLNGNYWVPESLLARRSCYAALGRFDTELRSCEDWDVWLRFARSYKLVGIPDVLIRYRVVTGSMSTNPQRMLENRVTVLRKHLGEPPAVAGDGATHRAFAHAYLRGAIGYVQAGDEHSAYHCLVEAARLRPALLLDSATYYELACSRQTRGAAGSVQELDMAAAESQLDGLIMRLAVEPALQAVWAAAPGAADAAALRAEPLQAQALWAIAMLHYRAGEMRSARGALLRAARLRPALWRNRRFAALLARTYVGRQIAQLKRLGMSRP